MATAEELMAKRLFSPPGPYDVEKILCRRHVPEGLTYSLADKSWEGVKIVIKQGKPVKVIDRNFVLMIEPNGLCEIPKTDLNMRRLQRLANVKVEKETRTYENVLGEMVEEEIETKPIPMYEMLENNILQDSVIRQLAKKMQELKANPEEEMDDPEVEAIKPVEERVAVGQSRVTVSVTNDGKSRRGRPPKLQEAT